MSHWIQLTRQHPSAVLLFVQLLGIVVYPFLGEQPVGRAAFSTFALIVLVIAVMAIRMTPALSWVAATIGVPVTVLTILEASMPGNEGVALWSAILHAVFYFYTAYALIRYMFSDDVVTTDEVFATGATFTVVAWAFAYVYAATQIIWPDSFTAAVDADSARNWTEMLFLSVTTLTSTGLSDIVPIQPQARSFVMLEQIAGMLYLALVVARIIALLSARAARKTTRDESAVIEASTWEPPANEPIAKQVAEDPGRDV
ncbi:two pore domain potassium channel family protein [Nocardioides sp. JQ2195]|uniref:potassium channel family protein n=1 Tax=Nocardioides sp. JQ2195 TaxID=2592334 RepID=UPI00143E19FC|nr:potassium channel family protein [Nocardioides sp. JQ2195]QIX27389.1 two pore domain potassium channel family protein [Nocardioides sp. JQ2195]